jgi:hypothetical protein
MPPITRANRKRRGEVVKWRCGACLFELPEHLVPKPFDLPFERIIQVSEYRYLSYKVAKQEFYTSGTRGCQVCRLISPFLRQQFGRGSHWSRGRLEMLDSVVQIVIPEHKLSSATNIHPFIGAEGHPSGDTRSTEAFSKAAKWIQRCLHEHKSCNTVSQEMLMPKRILFIEGINPHEVRLIEDADKLPSQPYICLSHRWMPETRTFSLTKDRAEMFKRRIPTEYLYPLLSDAIETTWRLGYQYIWIDCLNIYQDCLQDWHHQASEMSTVYENAAITLSALSSDHSPNNRRMFSRRTPPTSIDLEPLVGNAIRLRCLPDAFHHSVVDWGQRREYNLLSKEYPLLLRGWAYQEQLLSKKNPQFHQKRTHLGVP